MPASKTTVSPLGENDGYSAPFAFGTMGVAFAPALLTVQMAFIVRYTNLPSCPGNVAPAGIAVSAVPPRTETNRTSSDLETFRMGPLPRERLAERSLAAERAASGPRCAVPGYTFTESIRRAHRSLNS